MLILQATNHNPAIHLFCTYSVQFAVNMNDTRMIIEELSVLLLKLLLIYENQIEIPI